jgi:tetratricopeptide (TPR) repeat protein
MKSKKAARVKKQAKPGLDDGALFRAEAEYAHSIFQSSLGNAEASLAALTRSLACKPDYAPALMSIGSVEYQMGRRTKGRKLFLSLLSLPKNTPDVITCIDEAGNFLIQMQEYEDALELYRAAAARFPRIAVLHQGVGCCASHERLFDEAVAASQQAFELDPGNQELANDLGYSLFEAGRLKEARTFLEKAVAMDPANELARTNLALCKKKMLRPKRKE